MKILKSPGESVDRTKRFGLYSERHVRTTGRPRKGTWGRHFKFKQEKNERGN